MSSPMFRRTLTCALAMLMTAFCVIPSDVHADGEVTWATTPPAIAYVGEQYNYTPMLSDGSHKTDWVSVWNVFPSDQRAAWLNWAGDSLIGTPNATVLGTTFTCNLTIDSPDGMSVMYHEWTITVPDLVFTSAPPTTVYASFGYSYQVTTTFDIASWSISGGEPAFSINQTGFVYSTGGGTLGTSYSISISATTAESVTFYQNYTVTVISMFSSTPVTTARDDFAYSYQAVSREPVTSWSISGATWLTISSSGLVTGTPPIGAAGQYQITVSVWTQYGEGLARSNQAYTLTVLPNAAYAITSEPVTKATANITYSYQVTSRYTVTSWYLEGPEWLHISGSGLVSGTSPNGTDGSFNVSVRLTLTDGSLAWQNYTLEVERQPLSSDDMIAAAFGVLAFAVVLSALVGIAATAKKRY